MTLSGSQVGYSGINVTGGGGVRRIFLGLKFSTPVIFWVDNLTVYFFGSEKSVRIFWGSNLRQANSSYTIKKVMYFFGSKISSLVFLWVHNIRSMYFFGCKILGSVGLPRHVYTRVPPWGRGWWNLNTSLCLLKQT